MITDSLALPGEMGRALSLAREHGLPDLQVERLDAGGTLTSWSLLKPGTCAFQDPVLPVIGILRRGVTFIFARGFLNTGTW